MAAEKEILSQFDAEWLSALAELKKWNEKKEKLDQVVEAASTPKLKPGNYTDLFEVLKKMSGDAHAAVSGSAIKSISALASGLREGFKEHAKQAVPVLFTKFKERRLVEDILNCLDNILGCTDLSELVEFLSQIEKEKAPAVKLNIMVFLERAILKTYIDVLEDIKDQLTPLVMKMLDEKDANCRDQALKVLGVMVGRLGESALQKQLDGMIPQKMSKVNEAKETVKPSKYDKSKRKEEAKAKAAAKAAKAKPAAKPSAKKSAAKVEMEESKDGGGGGELLEFDMGGGMEAPKKKPPNIGKKPPSRKEKAAAEAAAKEKEEEEKKSAPPRAFGEKPKTAAKPAGGGGKTVSASDIQEEDVGEGLSKDQAIEKVTEFYDGENVSKFEDAKWQVKVEGFTGLKAEIEEKKPDQLMVEATVKFIKARMKDWKESNLNMMKEAIFTFQTIVANCERVPKRAVVVYIPFLSDKIGDIKMSAAIKELLMDLSQFVSAKFISLQIVKKGLAAKAPNNIKESANFLASLIDEYGGGKVAVKECIDFATFCANHANKNVRDASMTLFGTVYKHLGEAVRSFLTDIKPSTMQLIDKEFENITPLKKGEFQSTREAKGDLADEPEQSQDAAASLDAALPREDITKQLNSKVIKLFEAKDWKEKVKGAETVNGILRDAKMRIKPDGINELMEKLKLNLKEANKAVVKSTVLLIGTMAEAVGEPIKKFMKKCLVPMLHLLSDKAALLRADVISSVDKWCEAIGPELIINQLGEGLTAGNPEYRDESLKWITKHNDAIKKCDHGTLVKPFLTCLTDKKGEIRKMSEELIVTLMGFVGFARFMEGVQDLKPALQQQVKPVLEKARNKAAASAPQEDVQMEEPKKEKGSAKKPAADKKAGPTLKKQFQQPKEEEEPEEEKPQQNSFAQKAQQKKVPSKPTLKSKATAEEDDEFQCNPGNKDKRAQLDSRVAWQHGSDNPEQIEKTKNLCEQIFGYETMKIMFGTDFKKHVNILKKILGMIDSQPHNLVDVIDVVFKWIFIQMQASSNTTLQVNVYDSLSTLFAWLISEQYQFLDHEAYVMIPMLCEKVGTTNAILKNKIHALMKQCFDLYENRKCLSLIIKFGCGNKSLKSVAESLSEVCTFVKANGVECLTEKDLKVLAKLADNSDSGVREGALQVLCEAYKVLDDDIWRVIGKVTEKVKGLLEGRFKKVKGLNSSLNANQQLQNKVSSGRQSNLDRSIGGKNKLTNSRGGANQLERSRGGTESSGLQRSLGPGQASGPGGTMKFQPNKQLQDGTGSQANLTKSFRAYQQQKQLTSSINSNGSGNQFQGLRRPAAQTAPNAGAAMQRHASPRQPDQQIDFYGANPDGGHIMDDDDDELLRQQLSEMERASEASAQNPGQPRLDPETQRQVDDIMKHIQNLKYSSELSKRVESLIALNEIIQAVARHEKAMKHTANDLISAFTHVLIDIFERPIKDFPLRFAKYFVTIVNKSCSCKEIMEEVREQEIYDMAEQLLTRLLIDGLDKLGTDKEGEFILKNLNASMLRCLENCNKTSIFCVLFNLLRKYKDQTNQPKLPGLIIKCLLKLSKILEKVINELDIERVLICIHLYLISIDHEKKSNNDDMGIRIVKTLVHEMVKIKQHSILEQYKVVQRHEVEDKHLIRWIRIILNSFDQNPPPRTEPQAPTDGSGSQANSQQNALDQEMADIIQELRSTETFDSGIPKLYNFLQKNPQLSLEYYLKDLSANFQNMIKNNLESYRDSVSETGSTPMQSKPKLNNWTNNNQEQPQDRPSFGRMSNTSGYTQPPRFGAQKEPSRFSAGLKQPNSNRPSTAAPAESTGGPLKQDLNSSSDRINQYQNKLSSMREKFQQRKGQDTHQNDQPAAKSSTIGKLQNQPGAGKQNLNTSFSAMNSSLQQKWKAISKETKTGTSSARGEQFQNNVGSRATAGESELATKESGLAGAAQSNMTRSQNILPLNRPSTGDGGATSNDLNRRLLEMKAKLAALKK